MKLVQFFNHFGCDPLRVAVSRVFHAPPDAPLQSTPHCRMRSSSQSISTPTAIV